MTFSRLARMAATRRMGIGLDEICEEFGVSHRTAQRMTDALETVFTNIDTVDGPDRRRRWRVADAMLDRLQPRQETAIEALEIAGRTARGAPRAISRSPAKTAQSRSGFGIMSPN